MSTTLLHLGRRGASTIALTQTTFNLLVALLVLLVLSLFCTGALLLLRRRRQVSRDRAEEGLPMYTEKRASSTSSPRSHHRRGNARPAPSIQIHSEKDWFLQTSAEPPSPSESIPEIRVTFPEEVDEAGKLQSGRVLVVRVGETSIGLEPMAEQPPAYQQAEGGRFQSIDLERVGGLVEPARVPLLRQ